MSKWQIRGWRIYSVRMKNNSETFGHDSPRLKNCTCQVRRKMQLNRAKENNVWITYENSLYLFSKFPEAEFHSRRVKSLVFSFLFLSLSPENRKSDDIVIPNRKMNLPSGWNFTSETRFLAYRKARRRMIQRRDEEPVHYLRKFPLFTPQASQSGISLEAFSRVLSFISIRNAQSTSTVAPPIARAITRTRAISLISFVKSRSEDIQGPRIFARN